ncbi:MAG: RIP metalloprotease RseP, partial [Acidobacteria bacterium]
MLSNFLTSLVAVAVLLGILIFIHELGHYAAAKLFGVRVEVFSLGFGKRLFGFKRGDTDYRLSALPLGGYVKMAGENPMEESTGDPGEFTSHPRWQRFIIAIAGPAMNIMLAIAVLTGAFLVHYERELYADEPASILYVDENSVAAKAGLQSNDRITQVDGVSNPTWETVNNKIAISIGRPLRLEVKRGNQILSKELLVNSSDVTDNDVRLVEQLGIAVEPYVVKTVVSQKPAQKAGLRADDEILKVNDTPVHSTVAFSLVLKQTKDKPVTVQIRRAGSLLNLTMIPEMEKDGTGSRPIVGFKAPPRTRTE